MPQDKKPSYVDEDLMSFGKYKNERLMDVPASYLHWLYTEASIKDIKLKHYIENNLDALKQEYPDGIWKR